MSDEQSPSPSAGDPAPVAAFPNASTRAPVESPTARAKEQEPAGALAASPPEQSPGQPSRAGTIRRALLAYAGVALVSGLLGAAAGWSLKRAPIPETRFVNFDDDSKSFLASGWADTESAPTGESMRWCAARTCKLTIQSHARSASTLLVRIGPFRYPNGPPQTAQAFLNEVALGKHVLADGMNVFRFEAPQKAWRDGPNDLRFEFAYAESPKTHFPENPDTRTLAAYFDWIEIAARP